MASDRPMSVVEALPPIPWVVERLRARGMMLDSSFDQFLTPRLRRVSSQHWTPLDVTRRVAAWIDELDIHRVVDVGSGAGKFCVATAVGTKACQFVGVEQRAELVDEARRLAGDFGVAERVEFKHATLESIAALKTEAYYLFNPFEENLSPGMSHVDENVELSAQRFDQDVAATWRILADAAIGTYLIKYNGFGGRVPTSYDLLRVDRELPCVLRLWRKVREQPARL